MYEDSVLQEVRAAREAYARSHGYDVRAMVADLRERDDRGDWPVVRLAPRRPVDPGGTANRASPGAAADPARRDVFRSVIAFARRASPLSLFVRQRASVRSTEVSASRCGATERGHGFDAAVLLSPSCRERLPLPKTCRRRRCRPRRRQPSSTDFPNALTTAPDDEAGTFACAAH